MEGRTSLHIPGRTRRAWSSQQAEAWTSQRALRDNATGVMADAPSPENNSFIEVVIQRLQEAVSREDLQLLLTHSGAWEVFVEMAKLTREEADALREALNVCTADTDEDLRARERYLKEFSEMKMELQKQIAQLHALADRIDRIHRNCTVSNMVSSSAGAASGVLTILGLALAPVTAGSSLLLSATGMGLGAVSAMTSAAAAIVEQSSVSSAKAEARCLVTNSKDTAKELAQSVGQVELDVVLKSVQGISVLKGMKKSIHALKLARADARLLANANRFTGTWKIPFRKGERVQKAFGGTAQAMSKGARMMGAAVAAVFLLVDVYSLVQTSKHLQKGAKAESAEELRQQAQVLERKLEELIGIQARLQSGLPQGTHSTRRADRSHGRCVFQGHKQKQMEGEGASGSCSQLRSGSGRLILQLTTVGASPWRWQAQRRQAKPSTLKPKPKGASEATAPGLPVRAPSRCGVREGGVRIRPDRRRDPPLQGGSREPSRSPALIY
uniref:Apolipoprotein L2 n=1 Tax=Heterocephalus glaber TaxID=10181 RepID=A0A0P6J120_HETGA